MVAEIEQSEPFGDGEQAARLGCDIAVVGDVRPVDDQGELSKRGVIETVLVEQHLERAEAVTVGVAGARSIEREGVLAPGDLEHVFGGHEQELGIGIDEVRDQPGAGDAVRLRMLARHPLHGASLRLCGREA